VRQQSLDEEEGRFEVDLQDTVEVFFRDILDRRALPDAGIGDQDIERGVCARCVSASLKADASTCAPARSDRSACSAKAAPPDRAISDTTASASAFVAL
jgi:hypothetical protein